MFATVMEKKQEKMWKENMVACKPSLFLLKSSLELQSFTK